MFRKLAKSFCEICGIPDYYLKSSFNEIRMSLIRLYTVLPFQKSKIKRLYSDGQQINIIFGCGDTKYDRWTGVDCFFAENVECVLDLRRRLPFKEDSIDLCYSEHFIEHLWNKELIAHLNEVYRILKPGGRYRIVAPAGFRFIEKYLSEDGEFFSLAFPWADRPMDALRDIIYFAGDHKNIFDINELEYIGEQAGFEFVLESAANESEIDLLNIDKAEPQRVAESLYVEMLKGE